MQRTEVFDRLTVSEAIPLIDHEASAVVGVAAAYDGAAWDERFDGCAIVAPSVEQLHLIWTRLGLGKLDASGVQPVVSFTSKKPT